MLRLRPDQTSLGSGLIRSQLPVDPPEKPIVNHWVISGALVGVILSGLGKFISQNYFSEEV